MTKPVDPELAAKMKDKVESELMPRLAGSSIKMRTVVAVNILALVDRQIGKAEGPLPEEWDKLREMVQGQPKSTRLINELQTAILKYDEELREKSKEVGADEENMRRGANGILRMAIMSKLKALQDADRAEAGEAEPEGEGGESGPEKEPKE